MFKILVLSFGLILGSVSASAKGIYDTSFQDLAGKKISMSAYKGKSLLIVNIASACGYTPQLKGLQTLSDKYKSKGLVVIGFPSNDFKQEPLEGKKVSNFCRLNYGVKFLIAKKSSVTGKSKNAVFSYLSKNLNDHNIEWNFEKFVVSKKGKVLGAFGSSEEPLGGKLEKTIVKSLK